MTNQSFFDNLLDFFKNNISDIKENIAYLIFYYLFCTSNNKLDFDLNKFQEVLVNLKLENNSILNVIKIVNENNLTSIKSFDYNKFNDSFGNDCKIKIYLLNFFIK